MTPRSLILSVLLGGCAATPTHATQPVRTIWLTVQGASAGELAAITAGAQAWEVATRGALALPVVTAPHGGSVQVSVDDYAPADASPGTVAWMIWPECDEIHIIRPRIEPNYIACAMAHELGHVLRCDPDHDLRGLMAPAPTDCRITRRLADEATRKQESK